MRLLFGALILLSLFAAAALWQRTWTSEARFDREPFPGPPGSERPSEPGDGWGRVLVGRPSGGEPYVQEPLGSPGGPQRELPAAPADASRGPTHERAPPEGSPPPQPSVQESDAVVTVRAGQTLSAICRERYGSARLELVHAVARYNHLTGPDDVREGQEIRLPSASRLEEKD